MDLSVADTIERLGRSRFRSRFRLRGRELVYARDKGIETLRTHATAFLTSRVAPAHPANDGRQTPMRSHPVFIAQHATATCCRGCIEKWHGIPRGRELTVTEIESLVVVIMAWIERELAYNDKEV